MPLKDLPCSPLIQGVSDWEIIWKDMKFGLIFCGRQTFRELYEFTEDLFDLVKLQALSPNSIGCRAAAIYLLYSLYFKQPARPMVRCNHRCWGGSMEFNCLMGANICN